MHSFVTSKIVKWCHLIWPTLYYMLLRATLTLPTAWKPWMRRCWRYMYACCERVAADATWLRACAVDMKSTPRRHGETASCYKHLDWFWNRCYISTQFRFIKVSSCKTLPNGVICTIWLVSIHHFCAVLHDRTANVIRYRDCGHWSA